MLYKAQVVFFLRNSLKMHVTSMCFWRRGASDEIGTPRSFYNKLPLTCPSRISYFYFPFKKQSFLGFSFILEYSMLPIYRLSFVLSFRLWMNWVLLSLCELCLHLCILVRILDCIKDWSSLWCLVARVVRDGYSYSHRSSGFSFFVLPCLLADPSP